MSAPERLRAAVDALIVPLHGGGGGAHEGEVVGLGGLALQIAISPQQVTIGSLLAHVRRGDVVKVHSLRRGAAEAMEAIAHGNEQNSKVVGRAIEDIELPKGTAIVAIVRGDQVIIAHHDTVIEADDHMILFMTDRRKIERLESLFQVGVSFV